jgi:hypothetical protein
VPESFKVLIKELASLGLSITPIGATIVPETIAPLTIGGSIIEKNPLTVVKSDLLGKEEEKIEKDALELQKVASAETPAAEEKVKA